jgi:DNA-binding transcriptional LysR family regulator
MELRQLRSFVAVAEERHFGNAARRLHLATPSLSQQIRALEHDLQAVLFHRNSHGVALTAAGELLLDHARAILARAERAQADLRAASADALLSLRITADAHHLIAPALAALPGAFGGASLSVVVSHGTDAVQAVREERADAAVVWARSGQDRHLARVVLREVSLQLALPERHPLAGAATVPVSRLAGETILLLPHDVCPGMWEAVTGHLRSVTAAFSPPRSEPGRLSRAETLLEIVAAQQGLAVVTPLVAPVADGVVLRPLDPPLSLPLELIWRQHAGRGVQGLVASLVAAAGMSRDRRS